MKQTIACAALAALFGFAGLGCATAPPPADPPAVAPPAPPPSQHPTNTAWPPLPSAYLSGRTATPEDVQAGRAVFAAQAEGLEAARALQIVVPQYAFCSPGIVVQAEHAQGTDVVGFRPLSGPKAYVTLLSGCNLLGQTPPQNW